MLTIGVVLATAFVVSLLGVWWYRSFTLKRGLLDHPNERSSHEVPTPRGGGLVMALVAIAAFVALSIVSDAPISYAYIVSALIIIVIGLLDDIYNVWFLWRLIGQIAAAAIFVAVSEPFAGVAIPFVGDFAIPHFASLILTTGFIVYFLNAYNFMDGIDGIAGLQAVIAGICWFFVGVLFSASPAMLLGGSLAAAALGFLILNWQPAKIFMGDAGSSFLGFSFAVLPIISYKANSSRNGLLLTIGILAVWPFIFDSIITLVRRGLRGEKVWSAHREHLYQRLVIGGWSHSTVTMIYGLISAVSASFGMIFLNEEVPHWAGIMLVSITLLSPLVVFYLSKRFGDTV
ncbi:MAG TPA: glycosyltransferase family 4 protein [Pyrinomonadaceae bacterium]|nr:glycosyltransferase family 4 protein [Pyrinomonadaceae bacterium]